MHIEVSDGEIQFKSLAKPQEQQALKEQAMERVKDIGQGAPMDDDEWRHAIGEEYGSQQAMHENALWLSAKNVATHDK